MTQKVMSPFCSQSVQEVDFPSVTICNQRGHDAGEYVRSIFNNFAFLERVGRENGSSARLQKMFQPFLDRVTVSGSAMENALSSNFIVWARYSEIINA
jgi:hypothetical protein